MKNYFKIGEISKLYNIGTDSLRYYEEIGLLSPKRDVNGYRMYGISEIHTLNVLRELRSLGFSMDEIKSHLSGFDIESTMDLFRKEIEHIESKQKELENLKGQLLHRIASLEEGIELSRYSWEMGIKEYPRRKLISLNDNIVNDEDIDYTIKKLQNKSESRLSLIGNGHIGATIPLESLKSGQYGHYTRAFCIADENSSECDDILPAGRYLSRIVKGSYSNLMQYWNEMLDKIESEKLEILDNPFELYIIDNHDTSLPSEFLTLLQIHVK